jgi:peroxiredoxin
MRYYFVCILVIFNLTWLSAQTINIKVNNLNQGKAQLSYLREGNVVPIDSLFSTENEFHYTFARNASHPGFYRLNISNDKWMDFIIDNEDVFLSTDADNITDSMNVISSKSNKLYYEYIKQNKQHLYFANITSQKNIKSFVARYIKTVQLPPAYQKSHSLDNIDFDDDDLLYSDAFSVVTLNYITLFKNRQMSKELLTKEYISAVDTILNKAKVNQLVYQYITQCLIDKFRELGFSRVIDYIVDHYVIKDDLCLDEQLPGSIQQRIDQSKSFLVGIKVPQIIIPDSTGKEINLKDINSEITLILFYASWCPHCQRLLPDINDLYINQKEMKLKIFAVSLDTNRTDWLNYIRKNNYNWINVSDLKDGHGKAIRDFKIYATPSMFLVNKKKELIAIPANIDDLKKYFN